MAESDPLPAEIQSALREFLKHPDRKKDYQKCIATLKLFMQRRNEVGPIVALAEIDDKYLRLALAKTLHEMLLSRKLRKS